MRYFTVLALLLLAPLLAWGQVQQPNIQQQLATVTAPLYSGIARLSGQVEADQQQIQALTQERDALTKERDDAKRKADELQKQLTAATEVKPIPPK